MYTHMGVMKFLWEEVNKYKSSHVALRKVGSGWVSGDTVFDREGKSSRDCSLDINSIKPLTIH